MINPSFIKQFILTNLEPLLNRALHLDPDVEALLRPLDKKTLGFNITSPQFGFTLAFTHTSIHLFAEYDPTADACIQTTGLTLLRQWFNPQLPMPQAQLRLSGQSQLLQAFLQLCHHLDLQWESALAPYIGDIAAQSIGQASRSSWQWLQQLTQKSIQNGQDFFQYDSQWTVSHQELEPFLQSVDHLKADTERFEMRLAQCSDHLTEDSHTSDTHHA